MDGLLITRLDLPKPPIRTLADRLLFCERLTQSLATMPALEAAVRSGRLVHAEVAGGPRRARDRHSSTARADLSRNISAWRVFRWSPDASSARWIRRKANRWPSWTANSRAAISPARTLWASTSGLERLGSDSPWRTVVGLAGNIKETNPFDEMHWKVQPHVYVPFPQSEPNGGRQLMVMLRAGGQLAGRGRSAARRAGGRAAARGGAGRSHAAALRSHQHAAVPERAGVFEARFPRRAAGGIRRAGAVDGRHRAIRRAIAIGRRSAGAKSACAWPWARRRAMSSGWWCAAACC